jgi:hypothetical protein
MNRNLRHGGWTFFLALAGSAAALADNTTDARILQYDWLQPVEQQQQAARYGTFTAATGENLGDPFAVLSSGSLWQDKQSVTYSHAVTDDLSLKCSSSAVTEDGTPDQLGSQVRAESTYQVAGGVTVSGNVHDSDDDQIAGSQTTGAGASVQTHLPLDTIFTAAVNNDQTRPTNEPGLATESNGYDAQVQKPLGKLPLSLVLKSHYVETTAPGAAATRMPSLEQSLVWKPADATVLQAGLRQEQYQTIPGIDNELNEALFADWSQKMLGDSFSWHSYAEMINTRSTVEIAADGAGANGTPQPTVPQGGTSLGSSLPVTTSDEKVTFSTGPSVQLNSDVIASLQYSSSWDQSPAAGAAGQEQRVSVSLKGSF